MSAPEPHTHEAARQEVIWTLEARRGELAARLTERQFAARPDLALRYGERGRHHCHQDAEYHLSYLADAIASQSPALFADYIAWAAVMLASRGIPSGDLASNLSLVRELLATELSPDQAEIAGGYVAAGERVLAGAMAAPPAPDTADDPLSPLARRYLDSLVEGRRHEASGRELAKKNAQLARLNDQKNQFLGMAAHDLRNPLEVILTYSGFLLEDGRALDPEQRRFVEAICQSSELMLHLVEDLLDLAKIESGNLELDLERVDLGELVEKNLALNRPLAAKKGTAIRLVRQAAALPMRIDPMKIEQVLNNLLGNAIKFSPPGSTVEVRVEKGAAESGGRGRVFLAVCDQGPGVPQEELDRLFHPFERTRVRSTGEEESTGLGLAIVKRIVSGHGGEIAVENGPLGGAVFRVSLPEHGVERG